MTRSPLYLSYGMPKSGSTLAFELTRTMLELAGVPQVKIGEGITDPETKINFVHKLDGPGYEKLRDEAKAIARPIVIKTHSRLFPRLEKLLESGKLLGHAVCRDPRDMALSMLDAAREGRAWGGTEESRFKTVADTEKRLHKSIEMFTKWADSPNIMPIHYERLAFDTESVAAEIAAQLGITVDIPKAIEIATGTKFTQLNRGISQRWKTEMDPADARRLEKTFKSYIETYCHEVPAAPRVRKPPTGFLAKWFSKRS
ncbi:MAG: sulfotransferase domain-containing protein [Verrucomicrobiota bacterium]